MIRTYLCPTGLAVLSLALLPTLATAQQTAPAPALHVEEIESGFVIAPDARLTEVNGRSATLAGFYGGWLTDRTLLLGGGAYWLTNRSRDFEMQYAGGLVRWNIRGHQHLALSTGVFVGAGDATLSRSYGELFGLPPGTLLTGTTRFRGGHVSAGNARTVTSDTPVRVGDYFVLAEPQLTALWTLTPWMRLDVGAAYRFIGASDLLGHELRGPSGSIAVQFGR